jgi:DNA-binding protein H-NS
VYIAGRTMKINGTTRQPGEDVPEANLWPEYIRRAHIACCSLLDLTVEQAQAMRKRLAQTETEAQESRQSAKKAEKIARIGALRDEINRLKIALEEKQKALSIEESGSVSAATDCPPAAVEADDGEPVRRGRGRPRKVKPDLGEGSPSSRRA